MIDFKVYIEGAKGGETRRDLFIMPNAAIRHEEMQRLMDEAHNVGLHPHMNKTGHTIVCGGATALFRTAWDGMSETVRGYEFTAVQGYEYLDKCNNAREQSDRIRMQVR